ncbi:hypothetical protein SALBM311S_11274 [Streptomyces alboniger]
MRTRVSASSGSAQIAEVAARPSVPGMRMSMRTMSGWWSWESSTASLPSDASPTTSMSSHESIRIRKVARSRAWSSASSIRTVMVCRFLGRRRAGAAARW